MNKSMFNHKGLFLLHLIFILGSFPEWSIGKAKFSPNFIQTKGEKEYDDALNDAIEEVPQNPKLEVSSKISKNEASEEDEKIELKTSGAHDYHLNEITLKLFKEIKGQENFVISPFSILIALSLVTMGSRGKTASELQGFLGIKASEDKKFFSSLSEQNKNLINQGNSSLLINNYMILKKEISQLMNDKYMKKIQSLFSLSPDLIEESNVEKSVKRINTRVKEETEGKVQSILRPKDIKSSLLVFINLVLLKGNWETPFKKQKTREKPFFRESGCLTQEMMYQKSKFQYIEVPSIDAKALLMKFSKGNLSMVFLLPDRLFGLPDLLDSLSTTDLNGIIKSLSSARNYDVEVSLPKFKMNFELDMKMTLKKLGVEEVFSSKKANLEGIMRVNKDKRLFLSELIHQCGIEVNEEGSKVDSTTMARLSHFKILERQRKRVFNMNHGFLFFIKDDTSHNLIIAGRFNGDSRKKDP